VKTVPSAALLLLTLTTITAGTVAWQQYQRAERLERERAQMETPAAETTPATPTAIPNSRETVAEAPGEAMSTEDAVEMVTESGRGRGRGDPGNRFNAMMENPEFAAAWQAQQKARLDDRYAALFRRLNLTPAQVDQFKSLLVDRQASRMDVMAAARNEGLSGRESRGEIAELMEQTMAEVNQGIRALLGDAGYAQFEQFERTAPQRAVVGQVEARLSYSSTPLTAAQSDALVRILAETGGTPERFQTAGQIVMMGAGATGGAPIVTPMGSGPSITDTAIARAQGVLTPSQIEALRQVQSEQIAQRQLNELMRQQFQRDRPTAPPGG
jgi:hypothetical protein